MLESLIFMFELWIQTDWYIALAMSLATNLAIYLVAGYTINTLTEIITKDNWLGEYIDTRPFKRGQQVTEIKHGVTACIVLAFVSLFARKLFVGIIPLSVTELIIEIVTFTIFYETYSYFVHRLLHLKLFIKVHAVHHQSVRTTPWSAYSVHPIEAVLIGMSAPLFMLIFPVHLGIIFVFHMFGVVFTLIIHSNLKLNGSNILCKLFNRYTQYHGAHHSLGIVNFGFVNSFFDWCFKTKYHDEHF